MNTQSKVELAGRPYSLVDNLNIKGDVGEVLAWFGEFKNPFAKLHVCKLNQFLKIKFSGIRADKILIEKYRAMVLLSVLERFENVSPAHVGFSPED